MLELETFGQVVREEASVAVCWRHIEPPSAVRRINKVHEERFYPENVDDRGTALVERSCQDFVERDGADRANTRVISSGCHRGCGRAVGHLLALAGIIHLCHCARRGICGRARFWRATRHGNGGGQGIVGCDHRIRSVPGFQAVKGIVIADCIT
jgi:hypothetical protein